MRIIDKIYIDGAFVTPHGHERAPLFNPATEEQIGEVRLGDAEDVNAAVAAAKRAFPAMARTTPAERAAMLRRIRDAVAARADALAAAIAELLKDPALRERLAVNGRRTVEVFRWERVAGRVMDYYNSFLESRQAVISR